VLLSDDGEGWPSDAPSVISGLVIGDAISAFGQALHMVQFDAPLELQVSGASPSLGWWLKVNVGAWVMPRHVGRTLGDGEPVSVHAWLVGKGSDWGDPPSSLPDLWAHCVVEG